MAINGISTQQVSGISPNAGVSANGGASIESVSNAISAAANKGITPAGSQIKLSSKLTIAGNPFG